MDETNASTSQLVDGKITRKRHPINYSDKLYFDRLTRMHGVDFTDSPPPRKRTSTDQCVRSQTNERSTSNTIDGSSGRGSSTATAVKSWVVCLKANPRIDDPGVSKPKSGLESSSGGWLPGEGDPEESFASQNSRGRTTCTEPVQSVSPLPPAVKPETSGGFDTKNIMELPPWNEYGTEVDRGQSPSRISVHDYDLSEPDWDAASWFPQPDALEYYLWAPESQSQNTGGQDWGSGEQPAVSGSTFSGKAGSLSHGWY